MADVLLDDDGDLPIHPTIGSGAELTVQRIEAAIRLHEGEWLPDRSAGLPWRDWFRTTPLPIDEIAATVRSEVAAIEGVAEVSTVERSLDADTGILQLELEATESQTGETVAISFTYEPSPHEFHAIFTVQQLT